MANKNNDYENDENMHVLLDDEVINTYMDLITARSPEAVYTFNTFFFIALSTNGYDRVSGWTKKVDIFSKDQLFIPVHEKERNHWCLISVNFKHKSIDYYDSLRRRNTNGLNIILEYLKKEYYIKKKRHLDTNVWRLTNNVNCPQQTNEWDCGVFVLMFAEHLARGSPFNFTQRDMGKFRKQICVEFVLKKLLNKYN